MHCRFAWRRYALPFLPPPVRTAHGTWTARDGILVRLESPAGETGFGEIAPMPWFGTETLAEAAAACTALGGEVDEAKLAALEPRLGCVRFALATAWPGAERAAGGDDAAQLPVAAWLPAGRAAVAALRARVEEGWRFFKWKVGVEPVEDELPLLDEIAAELPRGARVRLDANGGWTVRQAARWLERCAERPVEFVEQPVAPARRDALRGLAEDYPTPIALDESVAGPGDLQTWIDEGWPGVLVVKPVLAGPSAETLTRLEKAKADVVFSSALETAVGARAALRTAFAYRGAKPRALGFGVWPRFADARFDGPAAVPLLRAGELRNDNGETLWNALS